MVDRKAVLPLVRIGQIDVPEPLLEAQRDGNLVVFAGGWYHSGDIAVWHPDGYIEIRDRKKDIIVSGGENISTVEVEQTIDAHPAQLYCNTL